MKKINKFYLVGFILSFAAIGWFLFPGESYGVHECSSEPDQPIEGTCESHSTSTPSFPSAYLTITNDNGQRNSPSTPANNNIFVEICLGGSSGQSFTVAVNGVPVPFSGYGNPSGAIGCEWGYPMGVNPSYPWMYGHEFDDDSLPPYGEHSISFYSPVTNQTASALVYFVLPPPPAPATIDVTPDRYMSWSIDGSPYLCSIAACSGSSRVRYSFDATSDPIHTVSAYAASANVVGYSSSPLKKLASKFFNFVTASSGSGATCNSTPGGNCSINLNTTYCSVYINGLWNAGANTADNFSFQINGPGGTYTINGTGYYSLVADPGGSTYNVISYPSTTATQRGYSSDLVRYPYSFTCSPSGGGYMEFEYKSRPILDVR